MSDPNDAILAAAPMPGPHEPSRGSETVEWAKTLLTCTILLVGMAVLAPYMPSSDHQVPGIGAAPAEAKPARARVETAVDIRASAPAAPAPQAAQAAAIPQGAQATIPQGSPGLQPIPGTQAEALPAMAVPMPPILPAAQTLRAVEPVRPPLKHWKPAG